jgi:hypothetical protein
MTRQLNDWDRYRELREQFLNAYPHAPVSPELESLILGDPERKRDFVSHLHLQATMAVCGDLNPSPVGPSALNPMLIDPAELPSLNRIDSTQWHFQSRALLWSASVIAVVMWFVLVTLEIRSITVPIELPIAVMSVAEDCHWGEPSLPTIAGSDLFPGRMHLLSGTARLDMKNTSLTLQGPVDFELISQNRCKLHSGNVLMESSNGGDGLVIIVPNGAIADLGAEIGIRVFDSGDAELHVFSGVVKAKHCTLGKSLEAFESDDIRIQPDAIRKLDKKSPLIDSGQPVAKSLSPSTYDSNQSRVLYLSDRS